MTARPFYDHGVYVPVQNNVTDWVQPMANWRDPRSSERQREEFEALAFSPVLISLNFALACAAFGVAMLTAGARR